MGRYATADEVIARFPTADNIGVTSIESHYLCFAENEVDSLLGQKFTLPFSNDNLTVKDLSIEFCILRLNMQSRPSDIERRKEILMKRIQSLIEGKSAMVLADGSTLVQSVGGTVYSTTSGYTPIFGFGDTEDFEADHDLVDDEQDERDL